MENDPKPYKFMKESIKKQPPDWKKIVLLIAGWLVLAALGGLVAAAVFAVTEPKIDDSIFGECAGGQQWFRLGNQQFHSGWQCFG